MVKDRAYHGWLFATVSLLIMLGISIYLGVSGWYFNTDFSQVCDLELGKNIEVTIKKNQCSTCSFSFSGGVLPGEQLPQVISVRNGAEDGSLYLRAKVYIFMEGNALAEVSLVNNSNWFYNADGYYYFTEKLNSKGKIGLCSHVMIDERAELCGEKSYITTVAFESLDSSVDPVALWGINPTEYNFEQPISPEEGE